VESTIVTCGCPLSSADVLDILGWLLDPGSPPLDSSSVSDWHIRFDNGWGLVLSLPVLTLGSAEAGSTGGGLDGTST